MSAEQRLPAHSKRRNMTAMRRVVLRGAVSFFPLLCACGAGAIEAPRLWDLGGEDIRYLLNVPQVVVSKTAGGLKAHCRCAIHLAPNEIPDVVKNALIATEDHRFPNHGGIDYRRLLTGLVRGQGASTLNMQLAKNALFTGLSTVERKLLELQAGPALDKALSKQQIIADYLNHVEFGGPERIGLYRAARYFFGKAPMQLNTFEAALLIGMLKSPRNYHPIHKKEKAEERAKLVLRLMVERGFLTEKQRTKAIAVGVRPGRLPPVGLQENAFVEWVLQHDAVGRLREGESLRLFVSLNTRYQVTAETELIELVKSGIVPQHVQIAFVSMNSHGHVEAMIGSRDWQRSQFNHATKGSRQPGSAAKLPVVVGACEKGLANHSLVLDEPLSPGWPSNGSAGYGGWISIADMMARSANAGAVRLTRDLGVNFVAGVSRRLGLDPGPNPSLEFVLGSYSTNVLKISAAYASVQNGGYKVAPTGVLAVMDQSGKMLQMPAKPPSERVMSARCAKQSRAALEQVVRRGTGTKGAVGAKSFGKTGTSTANTDAWFVGAAEGLVATVWFGEYDGPPTPLMTGGGLPANYFQRFASRVLQMNQDRRKHQKTKVTSQVSQKPVRNWLASRDAMSLSR